MNKVIPRYSFADATIPSVGDIEERVRESEDPDVVRRRPQLLTSINRVVRSAELEPDVTPFVPMTMRTAFSRYTPATSGLSKKSVQNDRSNLNFLLDHFQLGGLKQYQVALSGEYSELYDRIGDKHLRAAISRLLRFAQVHGVSLTEIDEQFSETFRQALVHEGVLRDPEQSFRSAIRGWNKLTVRFPESALQSLTLPKCRQSWALPWDAFPRSLVEEIEEWFKIRSEEQDLFDPHAPDHVLRPRTIETQKEWLRVLASASVHSGIEVSSIASLRELVRPETVESAIRWRLEVQKAECTEYTVMLVAQAITITKSFCEPTDADIKRLGKFEHRLRRHVAQCGNANARHERLIQFESRDNVLKMMALTDHVMNTVRKRAKPTRSDALLVQLALVHELFIVTSMRRANVVGLDLTRHLNWPDGMDGGKCVIRIPGDEVKNNETLHKELPDYVTELLREYIEIWRPLLTNRPSNWLFPGRTKGHKGANTLTHQYARFVHDWTGLDVNPHLVRSFGDMVYTERHPGGGEVMRRQLGHRSAETRLKHYADPRSRAAGRAYQELILEERTEAKGLPALFKGNKKPKHASRARGKNK